MNKNEPKVGEFYYHFKHDVKKGINDMAYMVVGVALHSETEEKLVIYKPLYESAYIKERGATLWARPVEMFIENVEKENYKGPIFNIITDPSIIEDLKTLKKLKTS